MNHSSLQSNSPFSTKAGSNSIGARSVFRIQVEPTTVSFRRAGIRKVIPEQSFTFPCGKTFTRKAFVNAVEPNWDATEKKFNIWEDTVGSEWDPASALTSTKTGKPEAFTMSVKQLLVYKADDGAEVTFLEVFHPRVYGEHFGFVGGN